MDKSLGTNFHFWRFCVHARREYNFTCLTSPPHPPYNVENYYVQFQLIVNIVLGGEGEQQPVYKGYNSVFFILQF